MEAKDLQNAVQAIARQKGKAPMSYREEAGEIIILWDDGSKDHYTQEKITPMINAMKSHKGILSATSAASTPPSLEAPPVQSSPKAKGKRPR